MIKQRFYFLATILIVVGIIMLCQPFLFAIHVSAFPVLLIGVALFMVLDHLPDETNRNQDADTSAR
jgi:C4-dicarboxylate transporter